MFVCILVLLPIFLTSYIYFFHYFHTLFFLCLSLFSPSFHLSPKDTSVSGVQTWLWFGFSKAMGHAGLFFPQWASEWSLCPHMSSVGPALPTLLIAGDVLDSVQVTSKGTEIHHCPRGNLWRPDRSSTSVKQSDFVQPLNLSTNSLDASVWAA